MTRTASVISLRIAIPLWGGANAKTAITLTWVSLEAPFGVNNTLELHSTHRESLKAKVFYAWFLLGSVRLVAGFSISLRGRDSIKELSR
jgi:hypothetical protein